MAQALGLHTPQGVLVKSFHSQSPALAAGLQRGDVITGVNGLTISTPEEFIYRIQTIPLEEQISLNFLRNNQFQTVSFFPMPPPAIPAPDKRLITQMGELLNGLEVANLSPALISQYGLPIGTPERGVVITEVGQSLLALRIDLKKGDIIESINDRPIESVGDLFDLLPSLKEESVIIRQGDRRIKVNKRQ